jgi:serine protease inhibitor
MEKRQMAKDGVEQEIDHGRYLEPEVQNVIKLTLAFAKAVGAHQADKGDNLVVSPYNAQSCLSMVASGADSLTRDELAKTLFGTDGAGLDKAVADYAALNEKILKANKGQVDLITANGIWTNQDRVTLKTDFADEMKKVFGAEISAENYADPATVDKINGWAAKNTNNLITKVLEELNADDAAVLASSLYFKGKWTTPFDAKLTEDKAFALDGAKKALTPTMHQDVEDDGVMKYSKGKDYEAVTLTYGEQNYEEGKYPSMRLVMVRPTDESVSARDWLSAQANGKVPAWLDPWEYRDAVGSIELPRLDIKQKHDLIPPMQDMGIRQAFEAGAADFTRMIEKDGKHLYVSQVSHDVVFKTDEKGSEAAAVTTAVMTLECAHAPPQHVDIKLDRSFVFALQDVQTNAVLFIGAVSKPNEDMKPVAPKKPAAPSL